MYVYKFIHVGLIFKALKMGMLVWPFSFYLTSRLNLNPSFQIGFLWVICGIDLKLKSALFTSHLSLFYSNWTGKLDITVLCTSLQLNHWSPFQTCVAFHQSGCSSACPCHFFSNKHPCTWMNCSSRITYAVTYAKYDTQAAVQIISTDLLIEYLSLHCHPPCFKPLSCCKLQSNEGKKIP